MISRLHCYCLYKPRVGLDMRNFGGSGTFTQTPVAVLKETLSAQFPISRPSGEIRTKLNQHKPVSQVLFSDDCWSRSILPLRFNLCSLCCVCVCGLSA